MADCSTNKISDEERASINEEIGKRKCVFEDDVLVEWIPLRRCEDGSYICQRKEIITKEAFIKCYNEWILNSKEGEQ